MIEIRKNDKTPRKKVVRKRQIFLRKSDFPHPDDHCLIESKGN